MTARDSDEAFTAPAPVADTLAMRIQKLLGCGLPTTVVASTVGCDPSYVSQLLEDDEFKSGVLLARAQQTEELVTRDKNWNAVEDLALEKALQMLPLVSRPNDLIRIATFANAAKRRAGEYTGMHESQAAVVNITLPAGASVHFQMNANSQVVEVDGRSMASLPTKHLTERLKERREAREAAGIVDVSVPKLQEKQAVLTERKKVETILEKIGYADEAVPVPKVMK